MALADWAHLDAEVDCESEKSTYGLCNVIVVLCRMEPQAGSEICSMRERNKDVDNTHAWGRRWARYRSVSIEPSSLSPRCL